MAKLVGSTALGVPVVLARIPVGTPVLVPPTVVFTTLVQLPAEDMLALGLGITGTNHPCNAVLIRPVGLVACLVWSVLPILPPVSRPVMRTMAEDQPIGLHRVRESETREPLQH